MDSQKPTVFGERIRQAREARGMTKATLADLVGVSPTMISNYEGERNRAPLEKLRSFSRYLRQPEAFFLRPPVSGDAVREPARFRSLKLSYIKRAPVLHRLGWLSELVGILDKFIALPTVNLPAAPQRSAGDTLTSEAIEAYADDVRDAWGLGYEPVRDLTFAAEQNGVIVQSFAFEPEEIDGVSDWSLEGSRPLVLLNEARSNLVRGRFSLAHEIGHLCLHRSMPDSELVAVGVKTLEAEANRFAGALLLPRDAWQREARTATTLASLQALKLRWKVSAKAMAYRSRDLKLIDDDRFTSLMKQYSSKGWQRGEPFDCDWPVETPSLLRESAELVASDKRGTRVVQQLPELDDRDLASLLGSEALCGSRAVTVVWKDDDPAAAMASRRRDRDRVN